MKTERAMTIKIIFRNKEIELSNWQTRLSNLQKTIQARVKMRDELVAKYIEKDKKD